MSVREKILRKSIRCKLSSFWQPGELTPVSNTNPDGRFSKWLDLPVEMRMEVVSHMDYTTRTRLSFCSRSSYALVNSSPVQINSLEIKDDGSECHNITRRHIVSVSVKIEFGHDYNIKETLHLHFVKRENYTDIAWRSRNKAKKPIRKIIRIEGRDYYLEAVKFAEKWLKKSKNRVKSIVVEMKRCLFQLQSLTLCRSLRVHNKNEEILKWWLERVDPNLKVLHLSNRDSEIPLSTEFLSMNHFRMCDSLQIWGLCLFTDEQFLNMKANRITIESNTITDQAINQFILEWINGKTRNSFIIFTIWLNRIVSKAEILKDIQFKAWDEEFEKKSSGFCDDWACVIGRTDCNQIEKEDSSGTSATLDISEDRIVFGVTGRRMEYETERHENSVFDGAYSYKIP